MENTRRGIANIGIKSRVRQIIVLIIAIFIGVLISQNVKAQNFTSRQLKSKHKIQVHKSAGKVCDILHTKKQNSPKRFLASNRRPKYKPMAEVDAPGKRRSEPVVAGL